MTMPTEAPAEPPDSRAAVFAPREATRAACFFCIWFWKTTDPITTEIDVEILRVKPNVAVAVAISLFGTRVWRASNGD